MSFADKFGVFESSDGYVVETVEGAIVIQLRFDYALTLLLQGRNNCEFALRISAPYRFFYNQEWREIDPEFLNDCHDVLHLFMDATTSMKVLKNGEATLLFQSGAILIVEPQNEYEAWTFNIQKKDSPKEWLLMVCGLGGDIAVF